MFFFKGRKQRIIDLYPPPKYDLIIEPFCGSAAYSCKYWDRKVILVDKDPIIAGIWNYLINIATPEMILKLPILKYGDNINDKKFNKLSEDEKNLIGYMLGSGSSYPRKRIYGKSSEGYMQWNIKNRRKIAENIFKVKHWIIINGDYSIIKNQTATWFCDPPYYSNGGEQYRYNSKNINYGSLSKWIKQRYGEVIVCDDNNIKKRYLPFKQLSKKKFKTAGRKSTKELIYHRIN